VNTTAINGGDECVTSDTSEKEPCRYIYLGKLVEGRPGGRGGDTDIPDIRPHDQRSCRVWARIQRGVPQPRVTLASQA
jgi:hypothetical protein